MAAHTVLDHETGSRVLSPAQMRTCCAGATSRNNVLCAATRCACCNAGMYASKNARAHRIEPLQRHHHVGVVAHNSHEEDVAVRQVRERERPRSTYWCRVCCLCLSVQYPGAEDVADHAQAAQHLVGFNMHGVLYRSVAWRRRCLVKDEKTNSVLNFERELGARQRWHAPQIVAVHAMYDRISFCVVDEESLDASHASTRTSHESASLCPASALPVRHDRSAPSHWPGTDRYITRAAIRSWRARARWAVPVCGRPVRGVKSRGQRLTRKSALTPQISGTASKGSNCFVRAPERDLTSNVRGNAHLGVQHACRAGSAGVYRASSVPLAQDRDRSTT